METTETKHVLPWRLERGPSGALNVRDAGDNVPAVCRVYQESEAEFLVRAANSHDALLAACRAAAAALHNETVGRPDTHWVATVKEQARAAIALAEEVQS